MWQLGLVCICLSCRVGSGTVAVEMNVLCVRATLIDVVAILSWFLGDLTWLSIVIFAWHSWRRVIVANGDCKCEWMCPEFWWRRIEA